MGRDLTWRSFVVGILRGSGAQKRLNRVERAKHCGRIARRTSSKSQIISRINNGNGIFNSHPFRPRD